MLFKKSQHGWRLIRQSLAVLAERKKLLIWPLIGRGFFLLIVFAIMTMVWVIRSGKISYTQLTSTEVCWGYIVVIAALWIGNGASAFCSAAFLAGLLQPKKQIDLTASWRTAMHQSLAVIAWVLAHFTAGFVITVFRKKFSGANRINTLLSGLSWGFATFLIFPVIISEHTGFMRSLQRSSQLIADYAGVQPQLNYSSTWLSIGLRIISIIPLLIGDYLGTPLSIAIGISCTAMLLLAVAALFNAAFTIVQQALYQYLAHKQTLMHFCSEDLATAISPPRLP